MASAEVAQFWAQTGKLFDTKKREEVRYNNTAYRRIADPTYKGMPKTSKGSWNGLNGNNWDESYKPLGHLMGVGAGRAIGGITSNRNYGKVRQLINQRAEQALAREDPTLPGPAPPAFTPAEQEEIALNLLLEGIENSINSSNYFELVKDANKITNELISQMAKTLLNVGPYETQNILVRFSDMTDQLEQDFAAKGDFYPGDQSVGSRASYTKLIETLIRKFNLILEKLLRPLTEKRFEDRDTRRLFIRSAIRDLGISKTAQKDILKPPSVVGPAAPGAPPAPPAPGEGGEEGDEGPPPLESDEAFPGAPAPAPEEAPAEGEEGADESLTLEELAKYGDPDYKASDKTKLSSTKSPTEESVEEWAYRLNFYSPLDAGFRRNPTAIATLFKTKVEDFPEDEKAGRNNVLRYLAYIQDNFGSINKLRDEGGLPLLVSPTKWIAGTGEAPPAPPRRIIRR